MEKRHGVPRRNSLLDALPLREWMHITVTPLEAHADDAVAGAGRPDDLRN